VMEKSQYARVPQEGTRNPGWRASARRAEHEQHFYARLLQQHFRPGIRWLDAGCGHSLLQPWLPNAKEIERRFLTQADWIVGADVDAQSLSLPCSIPRVACDLERLVFDQETFDLITCNMVAEHLSAPQLVFREFFRVLKPGGVALILTPNLHHWTNGLAWLTPFWFHKWALKKLGERPPEDIFPTLYRCNTPAAIHKSLSSAGFSSIAVHLVPGRPRLVDFGALFYPEYLFYRFSLRFPQLREILCALARKPQAADDAPALSTQVVHRNGSQFSAQGA